MAKLAPREKLIADAVKLGKHKTKKEAVTAALEEYVKKLRRPGILELIGKIEYYDDYNYKALRTRKKRR